MDTNKQTGRKSRKKNITSEEIVERHLHDPRDVITTEDIQNVKVPPPDEADETNRILTIDEEDINSDKTDSEEKKEHKGEVTTPWDVIDP